MPIIGTIASSNQSIKLTNFNSIASTTLGSTAQIINFTNIAGYKHLQIRGRAATNDGNDRALLLYFNNDVSTSYAGHSLRAISGTVSSTNQTGQSYINAFAGGSGLTGLNGNAGHWTNFIIDILDVNDTTKFHTARIMSGYNPLGNGTVGLSSGVLLKTDAVTSVYLTVSYASGFRAGSTFALYGIS
jgi:hypothetical protein